MSNIDIYNEWIEIANIDYELAKRVFDERWPKQFITICYHSQQAAEKYLKGYLAYKEEEIIKTHMLDELLEICQKYDNLFKELKPKGEFLIPFASEIRYPKNTFDITEIEAKKALESAKEIMDFVRDKVKKEEKND